MRHLLCMVSLALPLAAWAQTNTPQSAPQYRSLTEADAVRLGLARSDLSSLERGSVEVAEADALAAGLPPNPTLGYSSDRGRRGADATEQTWLIAQTFDVSGRRGLRREAAGVRVDVASVGNAQRRKEIAAEIRYRFHEVLLKQETISSTEAWTRRFARVEGIVDKLARSGEASGYDRRRLARERQTAQARLSVEQADLERAHERLAALIGAPGAPLDPVNGVLAPAGLPALDQALGGLERRPDLQALARRAEAADLDGRAASRGWVPDITVGVGPKYTDNGVGRDTSTVVTLSIPLPVFDRQQAGARRAIADALSARSEYALIRARAEGDLRGLHRQVERLSTAAADYRTRAVAGSAELLRIAEAAYQGGESTLLELLDAYRGALDAEITALDLEWKARQARIEYDLLTGSVTE